MIKQKRNGEQRELVAETVFASSSQRARQLPLNRHFRA